MKITQRINKQAAKAQAILRKKSVIAHWGWGVMAAITMWQFAPMGVFFILLFAGWEYWNDVEEAKRTANYQWSGCWDFWDMMVAFAVAFVTILSCHLAGVLTIQWIFKLGDYPCLTFLIKFPKFCFPFASLVLKNIDFFRNILYHQIQLRFIGIYKFL